MLQLILLPPPVHWSAMGSSITQPVSWFPAHAGSPAMIWFVGPAWVPLSPASVHGRALPPVGTQVAPAWARPLKSALLPPPPGVGVDVGPQMFGGIATGGFDFGAGPGVLVAVGQVVGVGVRVGDG